MNFKIDEIDKTILNIIKNNARTPYSDIGKKCKVSGATIQLRIQKMFDAGIISGSQFNINPKGLGYYTCAFISIQINLTSTITHEEVYKKITQIPEIVECQHISGKYSLIIKIYTINNEHLKKIIVEKIQAIPEIVGTETFIALEEGFMRQLPVD